MKWGITLTLLISSIQTFKEQVLNNETSQRYWIKKKKENIENAAIANQFNIDLEVPEIWILLSLLISPINLKQALLIEHDMNDWNDG